MRKARKFISIAILHDTTITSFDDYKIHENDEVNFIKSGKNWYGDVFDLVDSKSFSFNFPNRIGEVNF